MDEGHCGLPTEELVPLAEELLEVEGGIVQTALELELAEGNVVADTVGETPCVFLTGLHRAERVIASGCCARPSDWTKFEASPAAGSAVPNFAMA
jgi:hypothetical protein